jgi:biopolymer transport protein ExbD
MRLAPARTRSKRPSMIPLIDVMLVLLFFFMLASSYVDYARKPLQIAPGGPPAGGADDPGVVRAELLGDGRLKVDGALFDLAEATRSLSAAREVRLAPAPGVSLQTLLAGWEQLSAAGVRVQLAEGAR